MIAISTPYRRSGLLYSRFESFFATDNDDVLVVRAPTELLNPTIDQAIIAREIAADPEADLAEWQAQFRSDISALFDDRVIADAVDHARPLELPPRERRHYFAFADASAGRHDAFALCIGHLEGDKGEERFIADVIRGRLPPFNPTNTAEEYAALARAYACGKIVGDAFAGEWVSAAFGAAGVKYETSPLPKSALYLESLPSFNQGHVSIPNHDRLLRELRGLERRVHRSGKDFVDHGAHGSDDCANALAGSLYIAVHETRKPKMRWGSGRSKGRCGPAGREVGGESRPHDQAAREHRRGGGSIRDPRPSRGYEGKQTRLSGEACNRPCSCLGHSRRTRFPEWLDGYRGHLRQAKGRAARFTGDCRS